MSSSLQDVIASLERRVTALEKAGSDPAPTPELPAPTPPPAPAEAS